MKILIAILSCSDHLLKGYNQTMRDTWLQDVPLEVNYRFFLGSKLLITPSMEDWEQSPVEFKKKAISCTDISSYRPKQDEIVLLESDRYEHNTYKFKAMCGWAFENGYDFTFQCLTDTYVAVDRLLSSDFQNFDYSGTANGERTALGGGPGFWMSRDILKAMSTAKVDCWTYDAWSGKVAIDNGFSIHHDERYTNLEQQPPPQPNNDAITSHIANTPVVYDPAMMVGLHRLYKGTL